MLAAIGKLFRRLQDLVPMSFWCLWALSVLHNDLVVSEPPKNLVDDVNVFRRCVHCVYCSCGSGM